METATSARRGPLRQESRCPSACVMNIFNEAGAADGADIDRVVRVAGFYTTF